MNTLILLSGCATEGGDGMVMGATGVTAALLCACTVMFGLWRLLRAEDRVTRLEATVGALRHDLDETRASGRRAEQTAVRAERPRGERIGHSLFGNEMEREAAYGERPRQGAGPVEGPRAEPRRSADGDGAELVGAAVSQAQFLGEEARGAERAAADVAREVEVERGAGGTAQEGDVVEKEDDQPAEPVAEAADADRAQARPDDEARKWLASLRTRPYGEVAAALGGLYLQSRQLGRLMRDTNAGAFLRLEIEQAMPQRLQRLAQLRPNAHPSQVREWVEVDLIPTLDALGRILSAAAVEQREGHAPAAVVNEAIAEALYVQLHAACLREGWFGIPTIRPYETGFDPRIHQAVGNRAEPGMANKIVEIRRMGRADPWTSAVIAPAHVIVGR